MCCYDMLSADQPVPEFLKLDCMNPYGASALDGSDALAARAAPFALKAYASRVPFLRDEHGPRDGRWPGDTVSLLSATGPCA